jgi:hypothetical protein
MLASLILYSSLGSKIARVFRYIPAPEKPDHEWKPIVYCNVSRVQ